MSTQTQVAPEKMIFRKTNAQTGRHISVTPQNSTMRHLAYGRILLTSAVPRVSFSVGDRETTLICLSGKAVMKTGEREFELGPYDAIYVPRDSQIELRAEDEVDVAEFCGEVGHHYPLQFVSYQTVGKDPFLRFLTGGRGDTGGREFVCGQIGLA